LLLEKKKNLKERGGERSQEKRRFLLSSFMKTTILRRTGWGFSRRGGERGREREGVVLIKQWGGVTMNYLSPARRKKQNGGRGRGK